MNGRSSRRAWRDQWRAFPPLARFGSMTIGLGALADMAAHLQGSPAGSFTPPQRAAHLVILLGMVATLAGILLDTLWPAHPRAPVSRITRHGGSHANR